MKLYVVNGKAGSGKTTFENYVQQRLGGMLCRSFSTVDFVKDVAMMCGWDGTKTPENRKFLSDLKDLLTQWNDVPYNNIVNRINNFQEELDGYGITDIATVFIDCREPKEIQKFVDRLGARTIFINRPMENYEPSNHADAEVENFNYDIIINNDDDFTQLGKLADDFIASENLTKYNSEEG